MGTEMTTILPTTNALGRTQARGADEKKALQAFEAYFVAEMLKRASPDEPTGLLDGGEAGRMYQDQLYEELARIIAEEGDFGIAESFRGSLSESSSEAEEPGDGGEEKIR
ncbi:MAG TPA: rod-binding protein [Myxococcota bacterium]|nr:rod-binding protein [Myxococcota bacterium]